MSAVNGSACTVAMMSEPRYVREEVLKQSVVYQSSGKMVHISDYNSSCNIAQRMLTEMAKPELNQCYLGGSQIASMSF